MGTATTGRRVEEGGSAARKPRYEIGALIVQAGSLDVFFVGPAGSGLAAVELRCDSVQQAIGVVNGLNAMLTGTID